MKGLLTRALPCLLRCRNSRSAMSWGPCSKCFLPTAQCRCRYRWVPGRACPPEYLVASAQVSRFLSPTTTLERPAHVRMLQSHAIQCCLFFLNLRTVPILYTHTTVFSPFDLNLITVMKFHPVVVACPSLKCFSERRDRMCTSVPMSTHVGFPSWVPGISNSPD